MAEQKRRGRSTLNEDGSPNAVDVHVGGRVRMRRLYLGLSQSKLARALGLTFQQIQKYERGLNRISASRLFDLSRILDVPVSFFFDDMPEELDRSKQQEEAEARGFKAGGHSLGNPMAQRETVELVKAYYNISDPTIRKRVYEMTKALAADAEDDQGALEVPFPPETNEESNGAETEH